MRAGRTRPTALTAHAHAGPRPRPGPAEDRGAAATICTWMDIIAAYR